MSEIVDVDVIVIGAGVVGCSLALRLAQAGRRVRVLEQGAHVAPGASSLNAGLVRVGVCLCLCDHSRVHAPFRRITSRWLDMNFIHFIRFKLHLLNYQ
jgi:glycine/D-amino acid oxidase-like deaminating enzyme